MSATCTVAPWAVWDDEEAARLYEEFCERHPRYAEANAALIEHADISPGQRVLDVASGTGRTAEAALPWLRCDGSIVCFEPADAMARLGRFRLPSPQIEWTSICPSPPATFDRILCGAGIWQMLPLDETIASLANLLAPGGKVCFNIPGLYLGLPDEPGGGPDPNLLAFLSIVANLVHPEVSSPCRARGSRSKACRERMEVPSPQVQSECPPPPLFVPLGSGLTDPPPHRRGGSSGSIFPLQRRGKATEGLPRSDGGAIAKPLASEPPPACASLTLPPPASGGGFSDGSSPCRAGGSRPESRSVGTRSEGGAVFEAPGADDTPSLALSVSFVEEALSAAELAWERWEMQGRLTLEAYRDWLKIPAVANGMLGGLPASERSRLIDQAYAFTALVGQAELPDPLAGTTERAPPNPAHGGSWRWERWLGWTAWRP